MARSPLSREQWAHARAAVEDGASCREVAVELGVHHGTVSRAAKRDGWRVLPPPWVTGAAADADLHVSEPQDEREPVDAPARPQIELQGPLGERQHEAGAQGREREVWGPPEDERSARLWVCGRCKRVGYDPNRREPWHTPESCDRRMAHLDAVLDDRPRPLDVMTVRF